MHYSVLHLHICSDTHTHTHKQNKLIDWIGSDTQMHLLKTCIDLFVCLMFGTNMHKRGRQRRARMEIIIQPVLDSRLQIILFSSSEF